MVSLNRPMTHREPDWIAEAPLRIEVSRTIAASPAAVWAHIADHEGWTEWFTEITQVEVAGERAGVGGRRNVALGPVRVREVFTAWEPEAQFAFTLVEGPPNLASVAESVTLAPTDDGCTITYTQGFEARRFAGWTLPVLRRRMEPAVRNALDRLAALAER